MSGTVMCMQCGRVITPGDDSRMSHGVHSACVSAHRAWIMERTGAVIPATLSLVRVGA